MTPRRVNFRPIASRMFANQTSSYCILLRYRIRSRVLQDVSSRSLETTILGQPLKYPICVAPTAAQTAAHPGGEKATAKGYSKDLSLLNKFICSHYNQFNEEKKYQ